MAGNPSHPDTILRIKKTFAAPREKVWHAWTDPKALMRWFAPADDFSTPLVEVNLRVGGKYRIQMKAPNGELHIVGGVYREIQPPERLVFTWASEGNASCGPAGHETLVTVELHEGGSVTELVLTHERFTNAAERDKHDHGWKGCLAQLEKKL